MGCKLTHEELNQKVRTLEKEITQLKEVIGVFNQAGEEKQAILNSLVELVVYQDLENTVLWANQAACESVGMRREEIIGHKCFKIWGKRDDPCENCPVNIARETRKPKKVEKTTTDGRSWYIQGYPVRNNNGNIVGMVELVLDITKRKQAEESLQRGEKKFRNILENLPDVYFETTLDGTLSLYHPNWRRSLWLFSGRTYR